MTDTTLTVIESCRICGERGLVPVLDLGVVPLANALVTPQAREAGQHAPAFPLTLAFCPACTLLQIRETVSPEVLFGNYVYFSSFSDAMLAHAANVAAKLTERCDLTPDSQVIEIASNDGYLLKNFVARGIPVLGIEPATNIAKVANDNGVRTLNDYFSRELAERLAAKGTRADVIIGNNVLAHVADLNGFAAGVAALLAPGGLAVFEFPYVGEFLDHVEFDTIYHEHLCYYSLHAVRELFARHALSVVDVERIPIHGGSLRLFVQHREIAKPSPAVAAILDEEGAKGLTTSTAYLDLAVRVQQLCTTIRTELRRRKQAGERLAGYGASAKGTTLLASLALDPGEVETLLDFVADRSTVKQGNFTPGTERPIVSPDELVARRPDAVLLLTWNFADEILKQQAAYLEQGGAFMIPIPTARVVTRDGVIALPAPT